MVETDLEYLLIEYADRSGSPFIDRDAFFKELSMEALYKAPKDRKWEIWTKRPRERFDFELKLLLDSKVCSIQKNGTMDYIFMPSYFIERVRVAWEDIEQHEKDIFPNGKKIKADPPGDLLRAFMEKDFINLIRDPQKTDLPIIQLVFSNKLGSTLLLASFAETRLLDAAVSKFRRPLINQDTRVHCLSRIRSIFPDRFAQALNIIDTLIKNPISSVTMMKDGDESAFMIWIKLCELLKEMAAELYMASSDEAELAVQQAAVIIEIYNNYYREVSAKKSEKESLLAELYAKMSDIPYFWTFTEIYKLTSKNNKPYINLIKHDEISEYILKRTRDAGNSILPQLLVFYDEHKEKCFIKKEIVFPAFEALINATKKTLSEAIQARWYNTLKDYGIDPAMKSDSLFENLLMRTLKRIKPFVIILYQDPKIRMLKKEYNNSTTPQPSTDKYFLGTELRSLTALYNLDRKSIIQSVKLTLPFWYSIPFITSLIRIFRGKGKTSFDVEENE